MRAISGIVEAKNIKPIIRDNKRISLTLKFIPKKNINKIVSFYYLTYIIVYTRSH